MRNRLSAIIIDPLKNEHDYSLVKTDKISEYDEEYFDLLILETSKGIFNEINKFKSFDCLITIGNDIDFSVLNLSSFQIRKKWIHLEKFDAEAISNSIVNTFLYNIGRTNDGCELFSIFTCTFNTPENVFMRLYDSLCNQTYSEWNWWILDDSTNDSVIEMIKSLEDYRITVIKNVTNHGNIGFNKHTIASICDGDYLVEVDHDDELTHDCLEKLKDAFDTYKDSDFVYSDCIEEMNGTVICYGDVWACGEGVSVTKEVMGRECKYSSSPNITPYSIRTIHMQPNHVRCWKKDFYHKIGGHNTELSVLDDMEILVRTFLNGKMAKINVPLYIQHEGEGERGVNGTTAQSIRFAEIQRTDNYLKWKYDSKIHERIMELGYEDTAWNDEYNGSILWIDHEVSNIMNYVLKY